MRISIIIDIRIFPDFVPTFKGGNIKIFILGPPLPISRNVGMVGNGMSRIFTDGRSATLQVRGQFARRVDMLRRDIDVSSVHQVGGVTLGTYNYIRGKEYMKKYRYTHVVGPKGRKAELVCVGREGFPRTSTCKLKIFPECSTHCTELLVKRAMYTCCDRGQGKGYMYSLSRDRTGLRLRRVLGYVQQCGVNDSRVLTSQRLA
ncbi:hypothetical protein BD769DRAFT_1638937 [Suillus cothurnatus]|nr:hypothetical protein BD769DRAFT_1638937 [Suillus cothurnatus]